MYLVNALNVIDEVKKAVIGKDSCVEMVMMADSCEGRHSDRGYPGCWKDHDGTGIFKGMCHEPEPCAVHTGCAAGRYHRIFHLPQGHRQIRVPAGGSDVQPASGRRDQPYIPENTVRTAGSDGRRKCDGGWHHKRSTEAVHRHGDTEPDRSSGTQMLPESQLDRFMICISMGYPDIRNEIAILKDHRAAVR